MTFKPYPTYKDSGVEWLGKVPEGWAVKPFFSVASERNDSNKGMLEKNLLSLSYGSIITKDINNNDGLLPESFETYQIVYPDDIVFRLTDLQNDKRSLRTAIVNEKGIITSAYLAAIPNKISAKFFNFLLRSYDLSKVFYSMGGGLRQSMKFSDIKRLPIIVPPLPEQENIAAFLDHETARIDALIAAQHTLIALLKEKRQALISHAVTRGLSQLRHSRESGNPSSLPMMDPRVKPEGDVVPLKDSGVEWLGMVPEHWTKIQLGKVCSKVSDGPHFSPNYVDDGILFLSARNVKVNCWDLSDVKYISEADYQEFSKKTIPEIGDILYTKGGTTGIARVVDFTIPFQVWVHVAILKIIQDKIYPKYLAHTLNSIGCYEQSQLFTQGATNQDLGLTRMVKIWFALPPLPEQEAIVAFLDNETAKIDTLIAEAEKGIELLKERRSALISAAVTGQIDVRDWQAPEVAA